MDNEKNIYRVNFISRVKNKYLRRTLLLCIFPFLLAMNVILATLAGVLFIVVRCWWENNKILFSSTALRWNVRKDDQGVEREVEGLAPER